MTDQNKSGTIVPSISETNACHLLRRPRKRFNFDLLIIIMLCIIDLKLGLSISSLLRPLTIIANYNNNLISSR